jgi:hypothetical protein
MRVPHVSTCLFLLSLLTIPAVGQQPPATAPTARPRTVLITGTNRGLGLELARQYAAGGWTVIATARSPESASELRELAGKNSRVTVEKLDVLDRPAIAALAARYKGRAIDVLIKVFDGLTMANSGQQPIYFDGSALPW